MDEYTFKDLIINPETPGLEGLIGKEVYFGYIPLYCVSLANENCKTGILKEVHKDYSAPFFVEAPSGDIINYVCIIPKKEEPKPKYIPFENAEEFLNAYYHNETENLDGVYHYLATRGIWLKDKLTKIAVYCMVTKVWDSGLVICYDKMNTDGTIELNNIISWSELYEGFTFLDETPCGRLVEEKHE